MLGGSLREGLLLVCGFEVIAALFWLGSLGAWPSSVGLRGATLALLLVNTTLTFLAVHWRCEWCAIALIGSYAALLICLIADFSLSHPSDCSTVAEGTDTQLGMLLLHLLWTVDACLLMSILGWITIAIGSVMALWVAVINFRFWRALRATGADRRHLANAIASFPTVRYEGKETPLPLLEGREPSETTCCAICIDEFEAGETLRILPCAHLYHRTCIDMWIARQGLAASCPLCKRALVPRRRGRRASDPVIAPATSAETGAATAGPAAAGPAAEALVSIPAAPAPATSAPTISTGAQLDAGVQLQLEPLMATGSTPPAGRAPDSQQATDAAASRSSCGALADVAYAQLEASEDASAMTAPLLPPPR